MKYEDLMTWLIKLYLTSRNTHFFRESKMIFFCLKKFDDANKLIEEIAKQAKPKYQQDYSNFKPGEDYVMYSGQMWDEKEFAAGLKSFLTGKWLPAGERVEQFQIKFSKKYNVKQSHMVNSGSSANLVMMAAVKKHLNWQKR